MGSDILAVVKDAVEGTEAADHEGSELLFVGSKQAGKSSIIHNFLMKDDAPKPTTALEYRFARRSTGTQSAASVANIWELGGGTQLAELLEIVLLPARIASCTIVIALDMSAPAEALPTLQFWLKKAREQVGAARAGRPVPLAEPWTDHADRAEVRPIGIPVVVLAHKWDVFEAEYGQPKFTKVACKALRYFAHVNGASLLCTKHKDKGVMSVLRNVLYHHAFATPPVSTAQLDAGKPLVVPAGADSLGGIGKPPQVEGCLAESAELRWAAAYEATFEKREGKREAADVSAVVGSEQYAEESIDDLRRQKRAELEELRRQARLAASMAAPQAGVQEL